MAWAMAGGWPGALCFRPTGNNSSRVTITVLRDYAARRCWPRQVIKPGLTSKPRHRETLLLFRTGSNDQERVDGVGFPVAIGRDRGEFRQLVLGCKVRLTALVPRLDPLWQTRRICSKPRFAYIRLAEGPRPSSFIARSCKPTLAMVACCIAWECWRRKRVVMTLPSTICAGDCNRPRASGLRQQFGSRLLGVNRLADAEASYHDALRLNPANGAANHNLAMLLHNRGELTAARRHYERAILLRPDAAETHNNLGNVLQDEGDLAAAEASFRQALQLRPDFAEALNNCAKLLDQRGQIVEAIDCYDRALRLKPDFAVAHFNRATLCFRRNQIAEALAGFQEALRIRPNYSSALLDLALVFNEMSRPDDAFECCHKALELGVDTAMLRATMASSLRGQGRGDEAIAWYRRAIEMCRIRRSIAICFTR